MFARRIGTFGVLAALAAAGSGLLVAQVPQPVETWAVAGAVDNPFGDGPAVALADGRSLIVAGATSTGLPTDVVSIFDPSTRSFASVGTLITPRSGHTATLRKDGRVLITGGMNGSLLSADVELFDPAAGTSEIVGTLPEPRTGHSAARLTDGRIVIVGGRTIDDVVLRSALVYDPETNAIAPVQGELQFARVFATATTLLDGRVAVIGGTDGTTDLASAEVFHALSESFSLLDTTLTVPVHGHSAVMLPYNGSVLIAGGTSNGTPRQGVDLLLPAEFPDPFSYGDSRFSPTASMSVARSNVIAGPTPTEGYAFVAGGGSTDVEQYRFATIRTDKDDYAPGQHAIITGRGWEPGETVTLRFQEDPAVHDDYVLTLTADSQGNIYTDEWAPEQHDLNVRFYLTASGSKAKAQTTFTDGNLSSTINFTMTSGSVLPGSLLSWSVTAVCQNGGGPNTCASEGYTHNGPVQNGYQVAIQQATNAAFTQDVVDRVTTSTTAGAASGTFAAPSTGGPFFYRARHDNQNLANVPVTGNSPNSWQPATSGSFTVTLITDTTDPVITPVVTGTLGTNDWYTSNVNVSWTVSDPESAITSPACTSASVTTDTAGQTFSCSATSAGGTASASVTIKRDASAPNAPSFTKTPSAHASGWHTTDVSVSFIDAGDNGPSGIASCTSTVLLTAETTGTTVNGTCTDNAGNAGPVTSVAVKIDKTGPISVVGTPARPADHNGWFNAPVDVVFSGQDAFSGVASCTTVHVSGPDGNSIEVNGICTDVAGNTSATAAYFMNYDATAPSISGSRAPAANAFGWNNVDVTVSFTCSDATSGLAAGNPPAATVFSAEGAGQSASGTCVDNAGNAASATVGGINIDRTAPLIHANRSPLANASGWNNTDVVASYTASDMLSGLDSPATGSHTFNADGEHQSHTFTVSDRAGNSASASIVDVNIDRTAPEISTNRFPAANPNGWNNSDVTVSFICSDTASGVADGYPAAPTVLSAEGANQFVDGTCVDNAGNSASASVTDINIDKTVPTISASRTPAANTNGWNNTDVTASYSAADGLSGLDSSAVGDHVFSTDGENQSTTFTVTDKAGNSASATVSGVNVDKTAPTISASRVTPANGNGWNNGDVTASYTASDATSGLDAPATGGHVFTAEGAGQSFTFTVTDLAGNTASATISEVNIDKTAPTINANRAPAANAQGWNNADVTASYNASDALSGLDMQSPATGNHVFDTDGANQSHTFTVTDRAGNTMSATISGVNLDKTAPLISGMRAPVANVNGWNNTNVTATYNASDALSGLDAISPATGSHDFTSEGIGQLFTFTVTDLAGNSASFTVSNVNIDKTNPAISASRTPAVGNANGWNNTDVTADYTAADALSGLESLSPATGSFVFNTDGANQSHTFTVTDKAGNSNTATIGGVNVDKTAPTISASRTPDANGNGWNNSSVTASYTASDATSGLTSPAGGSHLFAAEGAGQSVTFTVTDLAGNTASATVSNVNIDQTVPVIGATRLPAANGNGWNNTDVVGTYNASDALSGLDVPATGTHTFSAEGAGQHHTFTVVDRAGNSATATVNGVSIDKTAPVVAVTGVSNNAVYTLGAVPAASCTTTDALSGVFTSALVAVSGGVPPGVGAFAAACSGGSDKAGNVASTTNVTFTVEFAADGVMCNGAPGRQMLQPINFTGSSVFPKKGGSTVPAKFRVCGADGVSIGPTPVVKNFVLYGFLNGTTVDINETPVEATNNDTAFRWSASDAQWIFNISTKELTAGKTYVYRVYLQDGTHIQFQFGLR